jgi:LAGLIDADG endonuclease
MGSDNPSGADNQQERPDSAEWVVGFTDGEGCFSISVVRNATCRLGWQVQHEFAGTQAAPSRAALGHLLEVFGCGRIIEQRHIDDHRHPLLRFSVKRRSDLMASVVPFFEQHPLRTAKRADFELFASILRMLEGSAHRTDVGLRRIAGMTEAMNRRQRSRFLESSEAIRQPTRPDDELKRWS